MDFIFVVKSKKLKFTSQVRIQKLYRPSLFGLGTSQLSISQVHFSTFELSWKSSLFFFRLSMQ